ncbi:MAG TPA: peroxiredoxin [Verrucomicrobiae bacterium]|nr:peroxiredoxin [Verrucomicrobiae bacterium]
MKILKNLLAVLSLFIGTSALAAMPKVGDVAPAFQGTDQNGNPVKSSDIIGKKVVLLYFYPKDFTGGCTAEACGFRDRMSDLQKDNVEVIGVSFDNVDKHKKFEQKYNLNFTLLADPDGKIVDAYGARMGVLKMSRRVSFLIGLDGKVAHVTDSMSPKVHFEEMKTAIDSLPKS